MVIRVVEPHWKYSKEPRVIVASSMQEADRQHFEDCVSTHPSYENMAYNGEEKMRERIDAAAEAGDYSEALRLYFASDALQGDHEAPGTLVERRVTSELEEVLATYKDALQEVAELAASKDDGTTVMARLGLAFSGMEDAGLIEL